MAVKDSPQDRLIAVDGTRGKDTRRAAAALATELKRHGIECAVSHWDASGLFAELAHAGERNVSTRTLSLVYAADLAFRLRWEIQPILDSGGVVIAAPYVNTAVAFGVSGGLTDSWLRELLRFAPAAGRSARAEEGKPNKPWKVRLDRGYTEYCAAMLADSNAVAKSTRRQMRKALDDLRHGKKLSLTAKSIKAYARSVTDSRPAASSR